MTSEGEVAGHIASLLRKQTETTACAESMACTTPQGVCSATSGMTGSPSRVDTRSIKIQKKNCYSSGLGVNDLTL